MSAWVSECVIECVIECLSARVTIWSPRMVPVRVGLFFVIKVAKGGAKKNGRANGDVRHAPRKRMEGFDANVDATPS